MSNIHTPSITVPPAVGEFAVEERQQLLGRIAELEMQNHDLLERMKAQQPSSVVLPEPFPSGSKPEPGWDAGYEAGYNDACAEKGRLNSSPVSAGGVDERAEAVTFESAFPGYKAMVGDAKASRAVGNRVEQPSNMFRVWLHCRAALTASAPNHSEQVRDWVPVSERLPEPGSLLLVAFPNESPSGFGRVTGVMRDDGIYDGYGCWLNYTSHWMPLPDAPSAGSQEQGE